MNALHHTETRKVAIIGCGRVGMSTAFALLLKNTADEILLLSRCEDKTKGEELDLEHGLSFLSSVDIKATEDYQDLKGTDVVIITAGASQSPGDTRLDLTTKNTAIISEMIPKIVKYAPEAVIIMVTNPVDILTYKAYTLAGLPKGQIFGTGTTLDTSRFRFHLSEFLKINPKSIHAYILGEHGDSSFPVLSSSIVGGQSLTSFPGFTMEKAQKAYEKAKNAAYQIIAAKGATYYAIAVTISHIVKAVLEDSKEVMPVSIPLHNYHGYSGVALSVPCVIGRKGVEQMVELKLNWEEKEKLDKSVKTLKSHL